MAGRAPLLLQSAALPDNDGRSEPVRRPLAYFITFSCYGTHLHGRGDGSVDRRHNSPGARLIEPDPLRERTQAQRMTEPLYAMDRDTRETVLKSIRKSCTIKGWPLLAAHVRSTHVHLVVSCRENPAQVMAYLKHYATRDINAKHEIRRRWTSHGSTRWLWEPVNVDRAIDYVLNQQGTPMAVHKSEGHWMEMLRPLDDSP